MIMKLREIKDPWIAKEKFDYIANVQQKLNHEKWIEFIDKNLDYYTWLEDTADGRKTLDNLEAIPMEFRQSILDTHSKSKVYAEFSTKKKYYGVIITFNKDFGVIGTTFQKPITQEHLRKLLDMAIFLNANVLNNGNEIIDEKMLGELE